MVQAANVLPVISPRTQRQTQLADALLERALQTRPISSPVQGLAQAAETFFAKQAVDRADEQRRSESRALVEALSGQASGAPTTLAGAAGAGAVDVRPLAEPTQQSALIDALTQTNPELAVQLQLQDMQAQRALASSLAAERRDEQRDIRAEQRRGVREQENILLRAEANQQTLSTAGKVARDAGLKPGTPEFERFVARQALQPATQINVGTGGGDPGTFSKELSKRQVERFFALQDAGQAASDKLQLLRNARALGRQIDQGALEPAKNRLAELASAVGVQLPEGALAQVADAQSFNGVLAQLVLQEQIKQKGPQTENDARRIASTLPRITNVSEANEFLFRASETFERRRIEQAGFWEQYREANGNLDGVEKAWNGFTGSTPSMKIHPATKRPLFVHEFVETWLARNENEPGGPFTEADALDAWRQLKSGRLE